MVDYMKEGGGCVAFLGTCSPEFYRKLGWEFIGLEEIFTMKQVSFDKLEVRNFEPGYLEKIKSLYAESIGGKFGYIIRDNELWQRLADVPQYTFLVAGEVGAYGILHQYFGTPLLTFGEVLGRSREGLTEVIKAAFYEAVTGELGQRDRRSTRVRIETEESNVCIQTEKKK